MLRPRFGTGESVAAVLMIALMVLSACGGDDTPGRAEAFPGIDYPGWTGDLPEPGSLAGPVWLVGIDGASWDLIVPMLDRGLLPNFARVLDGGSWGVLRSEDPSISPALWATVATGVPRWVHQVDNFLIKLPGSYDTVEAGPPDRHAPALWERVDVAGGQSLVLGWFGSFPAEPISGIYVSKGFDHENPAPGQVHPPDVAGRLARETVVRIPRVAVEQVGTEGLLGERLIEDARTTAFLEALAKVENPDLVAIYFSGIDVAQHLTWKHMDSSYTPFPGEGPRQEELAGVIPAYYRYVDTLLGRILDAAPGDATFVVVSDHGAGPMEPEDAIHFRLEELLARLGYTASAGETGATDWARTTAFAISELYRKDKRIWLNLAGVEPQGWVPQDAAADTAHEVAERLRDLRTESGEALFESVKVHVGEADWIPGDPALTVRFARDAFLTATVSDGDAVVDFAPVRLRHDDVSGGHRLEGIVILNGPAIKAGPIEVEATLYNIAPTVLYLLGLPQDAAMLRTAPVGGGVLTEALRSDLLAEYPILMIDGYPGLDRSLLVRRRGDELRQDPAHAVALEQLRGLGYVE